MRPKYSRFLYLMRKYFVSTARPIDNKSRQLGRNGHRPRIRQTLSDFTRRKSEHRDECVPLCGSCGESRRPRGDPLTGSDTSRTAPQSRSVLCRFEPFLPAVGGGGARVRPARCDNQPPMAGWLSQPCGESISKRAGNREKCREPEEMPGWERRDACRDPGGCARFQARVVNLDHACG